MELDLKEKGILILYKFLFNKDYKPSKSMNNHNNIQAAFHLCDTLWIPLVEEYGFMWDLNGPSSILLEENLDKLDKKEEQIKAFYASPDISIEDLWYRAQIKKLIASLKASSPFLKRILISLLYIKRPCLSFIIFFLQSSNVFI